MDDASTDGSQGLLSDYCKNPHVSAVVFNETNSGNPFVQWTKGLSLAKGKYIWIAESDDIADITFLERTVALLEENPSASICFTGSYLIDGQGRQLSADWDKWTRKQKKSLFKVYNGIKYLEQKLVLKNYIYNASSVLFRREIYEGIDSAYKSYKYCGDWLFWVEIVRKGDVIEVYEKLNYFRQHLHKVSPKSEAEGLHFTEGLKIYSYINSISSISWLKKRCVLGRFYRKIKRFKNYDSLDRKKAIFLNYKTMYPFGGLNELIYAIWRVFDKM